MGQWSALTWETARDTRQSGGGWMVEGVRGRVRVEERERVGAMHPLSHVFDRGVFPTGVKKKKKQEGLTGLSELSLSHVRVRAHTHAQVSLQTCFCHRKGPPPLLPARTKFSSLVGGARGKRFNFRVTSCGADHLFCPPMAAESL